MDIIFAFNGETNETTERELNTQELENLSLIQAGEAEKIANEKTTKEARTAAIAHAKSLGFTDAMIAVMYPNLGV